MASSLSTTSPPSISINFLEDSSTQSLIETQTDCNQSSDDCHDNSSATSNDSSTISQKKEIDLSQHFYQLETLSCLWIIFLLIVIGNAAVLIALTLSKGRKSRMNFFIKNLAAADLLVGLVYVLTEIIWKTTISFNAGWVMCKLVRYLQTVVTYASTFVLVALSIDRYDAITHPMNFSGSWRRARILVIVAWVLSFAFSLPIPFLYGMKETKLYGSQCSIDFKEFQLFEMTITSTFQWRFYFTLVSITVFIIPALLIAGCYIVIVCTIWNKGKDTALMPAAAANGNGTVTTAGGHVIQVKQKSFNQNNDTNGSSSSHLLSGKGSGRGEDELESRRASSRGLIPKAKVKTVKMTFVIIFVFILCWSPYIIYDLLQVYGVIPNMTVSSGFTAAVATFIQSLSCLNSAANPLIYCLFSTNICATLCSLLGCRKRPVTMGTGMTTTTHSTKPSANSTVSLLGNSGIRGNRQKEVISLSNSRPLFKSSDSIHSEKRKLQQIP